MGAEECCDDHMEVSFSDSQGFREVQRVLQSVRMVRTFHPGSSRLI